MLVIGAMKGGTTSLHRYLTSHPQVLPGRVKEVHFLDRDHARGLGYYRAAFPTT